MNNIDLEGRVEDNYTSSRIKTVEMDVSGFLGKRTAFELPPKIGFEVIFEGKEYYGKLDENARGNPPKIFTSADGITILADEKYDLESKLELGAKPHDVLEFWRVRVAEATGGGGAHNTAFGQQVYLSETKNQDLHVSLLVPVGHALIQQRLPKGLVYTPLYGIDNNEVPINLNFAPANGKKITLRSKAKHTYNDKVDLGVSPGDVIVLNTVRDTKYLKLLEDTLYSNREIRLFLAATDSMIQSLGRDKILELMKRSDIYVSNREELEIMVGEQINDAQSFARVMYDVQSHLQARDGSPGRVYITFGDKGSAVVGEEKNVYYQPIAAGNIDPFRKLNVVNTNGCGDAYLSVVVIKESLSLPTLEILNDANAAGHICATMPTASGMWMATENRIKDFRDKYGKPDFHRYDKQRKEFIRMRI